MPKAIFVPGLLCTDELFSPQKAALSGALEIAIGDHRSDGDFTKMAERILGDAPEEFVYAGLSMGGYAGFEVLRQAPERVKALILMNTSARADTPEKTERRKALIATAQNQSLDVVAEELLPLLLAKRHHGNKTMTDAVLRMAGDTGLASFVTQEAAIMGRVDSRPSLGAISCPTLVIVGDEDTLTPPELAREIADGIASAQLVVIEKCGHLSSIEQGDAVSQAIKSFLDGAGI